MPPEHVRRCARLVDARKKIATEISFMMELLLYLCQHVIPFLKPLDCKLTCEDAGRFLG